MNHSQRMMRGFTLIEIMVVVVIIGILIALVAPNILGRVDEARVTAARTDITTLESALEMYRLDNHHYPTTDQSLQALVTKPNGEPVPRKWKPEGYLKKGKLPKDPWGNDYLYVSPGSNRQPFEIYSMGADGKDGGEGYDADIFNWAE
jgi:general secretion pathway protein G